ncbi:hypothetical protein [Pseudanabaena yagii]|uniref:Uncharacterized protein n=1 Tax=Pseudanabaena yagii GIHE-NHR1 TaxID=2722753 RepID=A0ABX1LY22_9CYAN|nr:hypothetical protein [Pseudanabaena yagii]NMF61103.1 hypothetical protein [Pseudanabaena yagii GIHE-NHR1]
MNADTSNASTTPNYSFKLTFNPEILRILSYIALILILVVGNVLTDKFVTVDPHTTAIYKLFGFNHACNALDHEPSRTVSAMLLPLWEVPFIFYVIFNFLRIQDAYREKKVPKYTYILAAVLLPIELLLTVWFRIVFVWNPEVNFLNHYIPYIGFQVLLFLVAFENILYFYAVKALPFKNNAIIAVGYLALLFVVTVLYVGIGLASALGHPVLDLINNAGQREFFKSLASFYSVLVVPVPLIASIIELKRSPQHTLSFE